MLNKSDNIIYNPEGLEELEQQSYENITIEILRILFQYEKRFPIHPRSVINPEIGFMPDKRDLRQIMLERQNQYHFVVSPNYKRYFFHFMSNRNEVNAYQFIHGN